MYELRSMLNTGMCADVAGGSVTKGANVQLYTANDTNAQKFTFTDEGDGWSLQNLQSQMFVDVAGGASTNGTNVQQYTDNDSRAQRWVITDTGATETVEGETCAVVSLASNVTDAHNMLMDVRGGFTTDKTNIRIYIANGSGAQQFALYPTTPRNTSLASPSNLGWVEGVGDTDVQLTRFSATKLYPCWQFPESWAPGTAAFEYRYRSRDVSADATGAWSAVTAWAAATVTIIEQTAWLTSGLPAEATEKALEYLFEVRSTANGTHSIPTSAILRAAYKPDLDVTGAQVSYDALLFAVTSDYSDGTNVLYVDSVERNGEQVLSKPYAAGGLGTAGLASVPTSELLQPVMPEDVISVAYRIGTDMYSEAGNQQTATLTVTGAEGYGFDVTPTVTPEDGRTLTVELPASDAQRVFTVCSSGMIPATKNANGRYTALYPFGEPFEIYATAISGSRWGASLVAYEADEFGKPCHAWNWAGGWFLLNVVNGFMSTERRVNANGDAASYNARSWQTVAYSDTLEGSFTASGVIGRPIAESDKKQLMELARAHHVTYRAPTGEVAQVGVDGYTYSSTVLRTEVDVSMTQESI